MIALQRAFVINLFFCPVQSVAAYAKMFYPAELLETFDRCISVFEVLFLVAMLYFRKHWQAWALAAVIFGGWSGYALYWYCLELPCLCMGKLLDIPTTLSIFFDLLFIVASLFVSCFLGGRRDWIYFSVLSMFFASLVGFALADWIYVNVVVRM